MRHLTLIVALLLGTAVTIPVRAEDAPQPPPELTEALQMCMEAVDGSVNDPEPADAHQCIAVGTNACQDLPGGSSTQGIAQCNRFEEAFWDDLLNYSYDTLKEQLEPDVFASLKAAQKAWLPWRKAKCEFVYQNSKQGSISVVFQSYCMMETTADRAIELVKEIGG